MTTNDPFLNPRPPVLAVCLNPTLQKTLVFSGPGVLPNQVNRAASHRLDASGKGVNVTRVLTQLGRPCVHLTQLGGALRPLFLELCSRDGLEVAWVESGSAARFCYTLIESGSGRVTELVEEGEPVGAGTEGRVRAAFTPLLSRCSTVVISGTKAGGFSPALIPELVREAKAAGKQVVLDLRGEDLTGSLPYGPDVVKPNLDEFLGTFAPELAGALPGAAGVRERVQALCRRLWAEHRAAVVLTRGADPVWYAEAGELRELPVSPARVVNPIGSGDAFTAGLAAALEDGAPLGDAVAQGARCGRLNACLLRPGVVLEGRE